MRINVSAKTLRLSALALLLATPLLVTPAFAAPFAKKISFIQPDATRIELWAEGDEFYAVFETLDGYTVVFDQATRAYQYAKLSPDGTTLLASGVQVGKGNPAAMGLAKHVRIKPEAVKKQAMARFNQWDQGMEVSKRWRELKAARRQAELAAAGGPLMAPPGNTTTGAKAGLCLLIDFDDDPATISKEEITSFCNGDSYTGFGNNGSVKKYFLDNSNSSLTYTNVVTVYIRIPNSLHPKSYYNDTSKDCGTQARLLIADAIAIMKALPNYTTEILPTFSTLTVDGSNRVVACNVFYAGDNGGVWAMGLWPHSWMLASPVELSAGGMKVYKYQMSNIGDSLELGTFCHENGHMLCGFPDIYDYDYDSIGGAGLFCLMDYGGYGTNPVQTCAYLKNAAGWATVTDLTSASNLAATVIAAPTAGYNQFYRYRKPGVSTEYMLVENRQRVGRDTGLPASGIAVWHID
jgi:M6 family metalloprotease-like protein